MRVKRRIQTAFVAYAAATGLMLGTALPASADRPVDSHNGGLIDLVCTTTSGITTTYKVGFTTAGEWFHAAEPRLVVDSTLVLVAYGFHYVWTPDTPTPDNPSYDSGVVMKNEPKNNRKAVCEMTVPDDGLGVFHATYWMSYTPR